MKRICLSFGTAATLALAATAHSQDNLLANLVARCLGPTTMGGRIADIAVYEKEPRIFFVATAGGGLWKSENELPSVSLQRANQPIWFQMSLGIEVSIR